MKKLSKSLEDYIEAVFIVSKEYGKCRVTDIQKRLKVSKPSIVNALSILKKKNLLFQEKYGLIYLTDSGLKIGKKIYKKHTTILKFLENIFDLRAGKAEKIACDIEHIIDKRIQIRMEKILKNFNPAVKKILYGEKDETFAIKRG